MGHTWEHGEKDSQQADAELVPQSEPLVLELPILWSSMGTT